MAKELSSNKNRAKNRLPSFKSKISDSQKENVFVSLKSSKIIKNCEDNNVKTFNTSKTHRNVEESTINIKKFETNRGKNIVRRFPLQDINFQSQNNKKKVENKNNQNEKQNKIWEKSHNDINNTENCSTLDLHRRESVLLVRECSPNYLSVFQDPLPLQTLKTESKKTASEIDFPTDLDYRNVTLERNYDIHSINDSLLKLISEDENLFFDESFDTSGESQKVKDVNNELHQSTNKASDCIFIKVPESDDLKCTPLNLHILPELKAIKKIRRKVLLTENKPNVNNGKEEFSQATTSKKNDYLFVDLISRFKNKNSIASTHQKTISNHEPPFSPIFLIDKQEKDAKYLNTSLYGIPGTVSLDIQENFVFHQVLYSTTYLESIVKHLLRVESKYHLKKDFLNKYLINDLSRSIVINWLIKLQAYLRAQHVLVYTAVNMMDKTIDCIEIPLNKLQLVGLASFWIALKYHSVDPKEAAWLVKRTGGAFIAKELLEMEEKVFQANKFYVHAVDPSSFIHYYILNLRLSNADVIAQCAHYVFDCSLLNSRFVHELISVMSAAAVFTSLHLMKQYSEKLWKNLSFHQGYYPPEKLYPFKKKLVEVLREVNNPTFLCREPYYKYCSSRYCGVSLSVLDVLNGDDL